MARKKKAETRDGFVQAVDPNREKMAASFSVLPGGPGTMDPGNVLSNQNNGMPGPNMTPYGDFRVQSPATSPVFSAPPSGLPQANPPGQKKNAQPYNMQQQPPGQLQQMMEGQYLGQQAMAKGLMPSSMGPIGAATPIGGSINPMQPQQDPGTLPLQGMPDAQLAAGQPPAPPQKGTNTGRGGGRNRPQTA